MNEHGWWHEHWYRTASAAEAGEHRAADRSSARLREVLSDGELRWLPWPSELANYTGTTSRPTAP